MTFRPSYMLVCLSSLIVAACGGGGSGDSLGGVNPPPSGSVAITGTNAPAVAGAGAAAALQSSDASGIGTPAGAIAGGPAPSARAAVTLTLKSVPIGPETVQCSGGGTTTISGEIATIGTFTAGDTLTLDFDNCVEEADVIDGSVSMTVDSFEGDFANEQFLLESTTTFTTLTVQTNEDSAAINGDVSVLLDTRTPPNVVTTVSGNALMIDANSRSLNLTNFSTTTTTDGSMVPLGYTIESGGTVTSSEFEGSVDYENVIPFTGSGEEYPSAGEFIVRGDSSSVRLIVLDNVNVRLEVDSNGDDAVDTTIDTTWEELLN